MPADTAPTIHRNDYTPPAFLAREVHLEFDLDPAKTRVTATTRFERNAGQKAPLVLDGDGLGLAGLWLDGRPLGVADYRLEPDRLTLPDTPDHFTLRVLTELEPAANSSLMGLYVSSGNFFTQCEAQGFRRITWFPDRPDVMARYRVTLRADAQRYPVLLSNGNLVSQGPCDPDAAGRIRHQAVWDDPFPKPSYLFAVVAGQLVARESRLRTASGRDALLQVWVEPGNEDKTAHALRSLENSIVWDERRFGLELDLDRFMIVAVSDFNMGAMENKGLNIFNTKYVFATPEIATDQDFAAVESVVGHEYFHNWTGNRVTCRDWFQLTLKEGLTVFRDREFSADMLAAACTTPAEVASARAVRRIEDVRVLRSIQFPEDAGPMAHPIRPESYQEINNFYTVTIYEKGAEIIRMMQTLVGVEGFRQGMDRYFARHDGQAVTCDDFVAAIADANGRDLAQFSRWYAQAGTPRLKVELAHDALTQTCTLTITQSTAPTPGQPLKEPFHIPFALGLLDASGRDLPLRLSGEATAATATTRVLDITEAHQSFVFEGIAQAPVPSLLRDFSAPVIVDFDWDDGRLAFLAAHDSDPFNRWESAQRLAISSIVRPLKGAGDDTARVLVDTLARALRDPGLDPAFKEQMLTLPPEGVVLEELDAVDPQRLRATRDALLERIARELAEDWRAQWHRLSDGRAWAPDAASTARRALRKLALLMWCQSGDPEAWSCARAAYLAADNMTDRLGALQALCASRSLSLREELLEDFSRRFSHEALVMDKYFVLQATLHRQPGDGPVLDRVRDLMKHPAFSIRNPNKVRALLGGFCNGNLGEFHAADGSGYRFWAEQVAAIDALNPQVAARIARALDRWRKFTPAHQAAMRTALQQVAERPGLSGDVSEILTKSLAV